MSARASYEDPLAPKLPVPRFVTLGAKEVNLRTGPGRRYPIALVLEKKGLPVEIVRQFDGWRKICDKEGDTGWVYRNLLSGKRAVIITGSEQIMRDDPEEDSRAVVKLDMGVIASLRTCKDSWCKVSIEGYDGWVERRNVWGVLPEETFKN
ncbi:MAG: hypothetical protein KGQ70_05265 [Alphaproteobacteria bacterium]|nr:hypothetical protein [Alphaproteobacteria bacterium]